MSGRPHVVSDVMSHCVVSIGQDASYEDVVTLMRERHVRALPVLGGRDHVVGVVSRSDLAKTDAGTAGEVMSAPALTVHPGSTLAQAARIMAQRGVKRLPVVAEDGTLEGVVSRADLLKVFLRPDNDIADEVRRDIVDILFPAPVEPVHVLVSEGVVTLTGRVGDTALIPVAVRLARAVEGVVDVDCHLAGTGAD
ncbi:CBS domain-containing protein [Streptomyces sp. NPDC047022]|uniref:CBS domain-containing protein n=1 Tax=Streptomyces sp. NPDC047022 TaxID=3155737 RepID=UPI0033E88E70